MSDPNVLSPEWEIDNTGSPLRMRASTLGRALGACRLGASLYELLPGGATAPYHMHHANEELLIVISGSPLLRTPEGERRLASGAVVSFPAGRTGAHLISNPGPDPVRVLVVSTTQFPDVSEFPSTGAVIFLTAAAEGAAFPGMAFRNGASSEFRQVYREAIAADLDRAQAE